MKGNKPKFLAYRQDDEAKYQEEVAKLSARGKHVIFDLELTDWQTFYNRFLVDRRLGDFSKFRHSGEHTQKELLALARNILNIDGYYTKYLEKFELEKRKLNPRTRTLLKNVDISLFETFYYKIIIQNIYIEFNFYRSIYLSELYSFIEIFCSYLGVGAPKKNDEKHITLDQEIEDFIEKKVRKRFFDKFTGLNLTTRKYLAVRRTNGFYSFYDSYISNESPLNDIYNALGESALIEVLRYGQMLEDYKKKLQIESNKEV